MKKACESVLDVNLHRHGRHNTLWFLLQLLILFLIIDLIMFSFAYESNLSFLKSIVQGLAFF